MPVEGDHVSRFTFEYFINVILSKPTIFLQLCSTLLVSTFERAWPSSGVRRFTTLEGFLWNWVKGSETS